MIILYQMAYFLQDHCLFSIDDQKRARLTHCFDHNFDTLKKVLREYKDDIVILDHDMYASYGLSEELSNVLSIYSSLTLFKGTDIFSLPARITEFTTLGHTMFCAEGEHVPIECLQAPDFLDKMIASAFGSFLQPETAVPELRNQLLLYSTVLELRDFIYTYIADKVYESWTLSDTVLGKYLKMDFQQFFSSLNSLLKLLLKEWPALQTCDFIRFPLFELLDQDHSVTQKPKILTLDMLLNARISKRSVKNPKQDIPIFNKILVYLSEPYVSISHTLGSKMFSLDIEPVCSALKKSAIISGGKLFAKVETCVRPDDYDRLHLYLRIPGESKEFILH